jgi:hypothetical protein
MTQLVECIACRAELKSGATICPVCKTNQSSWRNTTTFLAGVVGLLALVASAATYVGSGAVALWREHFWKDDVELIHFASAEKGLLANVGSGDIFVVQIEVYYGNSSISFNINQSIDKGKLASVEIKKHRENDPILSFLAAEQAISPSEYARSVKLECFADIFMSPNYPPVERMKKFYEPRKLVMSDASADVIFVSGKTGSVMRKRFPVYWLLTKNKIPECQ